MKISLFDKILRHYRYYLFSYKKCFIYEYISQNKIVLPNLNIENYEFFLLKEKKQINALTKKDYNFNNFSIIGNYVDVDIENCYIFVYFINKKLAHINCWWTKTPEHYYKKMWHTYTLRKYSSKTSVFMGPAYTNLEYRGRGLYYYDLLNAIQYFESKGYKKFYGEVQNYKKEVKFLLSAAGFKIIKKAIKINILKNIFYINIKNKS